MVSLGLRFPDKGLRFPDKGLHFPDNIYGICSVYILTLQYPNKLWYIQGQL